MPQGHVHVLASFNNTIITITDLSRCQVISWGSAGVAGFKGSRKSTPYAAAHVGRDRRPQGDGARDAPGRGLRQGSGRRPRAGRSDPSRSPASRSPPSPTSRPFHTTDAARRSGAASDRRQEPMARYTESVCRLCRREGAKLFLKGTPLLFQEVRLRAPSEPARPARRPPSQDGRLRHPASREAEGSPRLFRPRAPVPQLLRGSRESGWRDRREPPPLPRDAPRQRRLPARLRLLAGAGPPARDPRPLRGQRRPDGHRRRT